VIHICETFTSINTKKLVPFYTCNRFVCSKSNFSRDTIPLAVSPRSQYADTITTSRFLTTQRAAITE